MFNILIILNIYGIYDCLFVMTEELDELAKSEASEGRDEAVKDKIKEIVFYHTGLLE